MKQVIVCLLLFISTAALAQRPPSDALRQLEQMAEISALVGEWEGQGWMEFRPGAKQVFRGTETVRTRLDGILLQIEGTHFGKAAEDGEERIIHRAFGILSCAEKDGEYRLNAYLDNGRAAMSKARLEDDHLTWWPPSPPGTEIRYTLDLSAADIWHEIGEMSQDGENWRQFFEMTLSRKKN